ncbi:16S rRNA (cytidine(1402)-2'-O)-methyltransferase [Microbacterium xanthum]|uniref:16S rRNA (cytidine(1402)-2'-O)-methyltransferase n=1 Tax=Microbacterium xanthum TaxID=3079794 RepID=UPI002AD25E91|nr:MULTISPECIES: 16S rRNA (cytidine(1402)-2'-O)-methyltransferase [unclassified Microbacterium]MDZ8173281.1 16S rRNA (cytidine(1402)-2'-O)-methyltransferase [Microbacterium sp. KSW-48]MDZ8202288.1 16S rRNA (cytidine(1402)-2'-O)-methyltransferase [Microbacterium sp. SSW1-59]
MIILAATPIGNLGDASSRLVEALEQAPTIAAEDTRTTVRLLAALGVANRPQMIALHDHNEKERAADLVEMARTGDVLVLSDAGMPTVSDPGFGVVAAAAAAGIGVTVIPGPSAVVTALAVSGLPTDRFTFEGFVPRKPGERARTLAALDAEPRTMVFFESPSRTAATLHAMVEAFGEDRRVAVCRELTKLHEQVVRGTSAEVAAWADEGVRGEVVIVVAGAERRAVRFDDAVEQVARLVADGARLKDAAAEVADATGHSRRDLYQAVLAARH